ncbi:MAG: hypothetical protein QXS54_10840 [Candidatus Methanomethylicaceae archaeon]
MPHVFRFIERRRVEQASKLSWPRWAYAPVDLVEDIVNEYKETQSLQSYLDGKYAGIVQSVTNFSVIYSAISNREVPLEDSIKAQLSDYISDAATQALALAAWRYGGKHVFVIHEAVLPFLLETNTPDDPLPSSVLTQLPYWAGYIPLQYKAQLGGEAVVEDVKLVVALELTLKGVLFAMLWMPEKEKKDGTPVLCLVLDVQDERENSDSIMPFTLPLRDTITLNDLLFSSLAKHSRASQVVKAFSPTLGKLVSIALQPILYLCAANAEARLATPPELSAPPRPKKPPREKLSAPHRETVWAVGYRIGAAIQAGQSASAHQHTQNTESGKPSGRTLRPHLRRAHWHGYRVGPGRSGWKVIWLPPIPVNMDISLEDLPVTQRTIKEFNMKQTMKQTRTHAL